MERRRLESSLPEQFSWLVVTEDYQQDESGLPSPSQLSSQLHHFLRHVFMLSLLSYSYLFLCEEVQHQKLSDTQKASFSASRLDLDI